MNYNEVKPKVVGMIIPSQAPQANTEVQQIPSTASLEEANTNVVGLPSASKPPTCNTNVVKLPGN